MIARPEIEVYLDPLEVAKRCDAFYRCPVGPGGKRLGPLVGYAGTYDGPGGEKLHFVGDLYFNFAQIEPHPKPLQLFADLLVRGLPRNLKFTAVLGAPEGGKRLAGRVSDLTGARYATLDRIVTQAKSETGREESFLNFGRHSVDGGDSVVIIEDLCNNFSTTKQMIELVVEQGASVVAVACAFNRSNYVTVPGTVNGLAVFSVIHQSLPQYRQDDPEVAVDVAAKNVVWKVKPEWARLKVAMEAAPDSEPSKGYRLS